MVLSWQKTLPDDIDQVETLISAIGTCSLAIRAQAQTGSDVFLQHSVCCEAWISDVAQGLSRVLTRPQFLREVSPANGQEAARSKLTFQRAKKLRQLPPRSKRHPSHDNQG